MLCPKCGNEVQDGYKFCDKCGKLLKEFIVSRKIGKFVEFDDTNKQWRLCKNIYNHDNHIYNYEDILDVELLENEVNMTKGGLGSAVAGGVLFGGVGAIVGSNIGRKNKSFSSEMKIKITQNVIGNPIIFITLFKGEVDKVSYVFKESFKVANQIVSAFEVIKARNNIVNNKNNISDTNIFVADELLKLKNLLDSGVLTKEEFEAEKSKLLK